jgi:hypothetical protein
VEVNLEYVKVGRRLLPELTWVQSDMYDLHLWQSLPRFDEAVSNPPFGQVLTDSDTGWIGYPGPAGRKFLHIQPHALTDNLHGAAP